MPRFNVLLSDCSGFTRAASVRHILRPANRLPISKFQLVTLLQSCRRDNQNANGPSPCLETENPRCQMQRQRGPRQALVCLSAKPRAVVCLTCHLNPLCRNLCGFPVRSGTPDSIEQRTAHAHRFATMPSHNPCSQDMFAHFKPARAHRLYQSGRPVRLGRDLTSPSTTVVISGEDCR